ncbi:hypothetical protein M569_17677 [Genlisea aurea]|uniref:Uncharacterized protein n=1 Tax=Genlisea aurea TaxID=192259 RepID=S8BRV5_9LAMI|nr:hypothetical protein M569_17677 [Genlisea aurea]
MKRLVHPGTTRIATAALSPRFETRTSAGRGWTKSAFQNADFVQSGIGLLYVLQVSMLPAQLANVAAAALPKPPPVQIAYAAAVDFGKVLAQEGVVITDLDEWLTAFAKWSLSLDTLFEDEAQKEAALEQRKALCERAGVGVRSWLPQTLKTTVNALALMYKQTGPDSGIVPGVESQFPKYCRFFNVACTRSRNTIARKEPTAVLTDAEVLRLVEKTNWLSWYEAQRTNFLLLAYQMGPSTSVLRHVPRILALEVCKFGVCAALGKLGLPTV